MFKTKSKEFSTIQELAGFVIDCDPKFAQQVRDFEREHGLTRAPNRDEAFSLGGGRFACMFAFASPGCEFEFDVNVVGLGFFFFKEGFEEPAFAQFVPKSGEFIFTRFTEFFGFDEFGSDRC